MMNKLYAARFDNSLSTPSLIEQFIEPEDVGIRWDIYRYGLERAEITFKCRNKYDLYDRRNNPVGQRMAIYDNTVYHNVSGFIYEAIPVGANRLQYVVIGPSRRMFAELDTTIYSTTAQVDNTLKTILTDHVTVADSDQSNIASNTTALGGWQTKQPEGSYPFNEIEDLIKKSDGSNNIYNFWLQDQPFQGVTLDVWLPYYAARSTSASIDWRVSTRDLRGFQMPSRDIYGMSTSASVFYGVVTGTASGGTATTCIDAGANFITSGVKPGDRIQNVTDGSRATVTSVTATTLTIDGLTGGVANVFANLDVYTIQLEKPLSSTTATDTAEFWDVATAEFESGMNSAQAGQYDDTLLSVGAETRVQPFIITSPWILDGKGARHPLWDVIFLAGGYIQISDLYPTASLFSTSADDSQSFFITALDYRQRDNTLRIAVDKPDSRLDARLQRANILSGTGVFS